MYTYCIHIYVCSGEMDMKKCSAYESVASAQASVEQLHVYESTTWLNACEHLHIVKDKCMHWLTELTRYGKLMITFCSGMHILSLNQTKDARYRHAKYMYKWHNYTLYDHVIHFMYRKQNFHAAKYKFIVTSYAFILYVCMYSNPCGSGGTGPFTIMHIHP